MPRRSFAFVTALAFSSLLAAQSGSEPTFELTIIHVNDIHANHEPQANGDGGDARQATVIRALRSEIKHTLLLDAGDRFTGTLYQTHYKGRENAPIMNRIRFDAMTLGNHEFDEGDKCLADFLGDLTFPVVCANVDASKSPELAGRWKRYIIKEVGGERIGIIGLLTADTKSISSPSANVVFDADYAGCTMGCVGELRKLGVNKIILLTHLGLAEDKKLAAAVEDVDAIVGAHSHTLMSRTYREASETYPVFVNDRTGRPVPIVQAGGGDNRFVGRLDLSFDKDGIVKKASGDTILLSRFITPAPDVQEQVERLGEPIRELKQKQLTTKLGSPILIEAELSNRDVRVGEAALANLIADAYLDRTKAQIALVGSGGVRATLAKGPISVGDVYRVLPFNNRLSRFILKGEDILAVLEHGATAFQKSNGGRFLQVGGLRYTIDLRNPDGTKVVRVEVKEADGSYRALDAARDYQVSADSFLRNGGDDFKMIPQKLREASDDFPPVQFVFIDYLQKLGNVAPKIEGRITILR